MKKHQKFTVLAVMALGLLVAGSQAKADGMPAFQGSFTLPSAIRWSWATLPAGDYSFTLDKNYGDSVVTLFRGTRCVARILTPGFIAVNSGHSAIVVQGGMVREVRLPQVGVTLQYPVPKSGPLTTPQEPQLARIIPVAATRAGR